MEEGAGEGPALAGALPADGGWRARCLREGVEALLGRLPPRTAVAMRLHYGLDEAQRPHSHREARCAPDPRKNPHGTPLLWGEQNEKER